MNENNKKLKRKCDVLSHLLSELERKLEIIKVDIDKVKRDSNGRCKQYLYDEEIKQCGDLIIRAKYTINQTPSDSVRGDDAR